MPPRYLAAVNCPSCGTRFQTPVEQILDVRVDPAAKNRMLGGAVNIAQCPNCGAGGALGIPFIYHDPEQEIALLYLPAEAGSNEVERQQAAGRLAQQLMNSMAPEDRKGYLLQPETFLTMDSMVKRVLELEGVTEEDLQRSQQQREFLSDLIQAPQEEWEDLVDENQELIDEGFFSLLQYIMQLSAYAGAPDTENEPLGELQDYLIENTEIGQLLMRRTEVVQTFAEDPNRETLMTALIAAPDEETRVALVQSAPNMLDYPFFQALVQRIESAESPEEKERLVALRREILSIREELMAVAQEAAQERVELVERLLESQDPRRMAASHQSELDDLFFAVLSAQLQEAQQAGDVELVEELQRVGDVINELIESQMPPEIMLLRRLMVTPDDEQVKELLEESQRVLSPQFFVLLNSVLANQEQEQVEEEVLDRLRHIRELALQAASPQVRQAVREQGMDEAPSVVPPQPGLQPDAGQESPAPGERTTPSGLIIAKH